MLSRPAAVVLLLCKAREPWGPPVNSLTLLTRSHRTPPASLSPFRPESCQAPPRKIVCNPLIPKGRKFSPICILFRRQAHNGTNRQNRGAASRICPGTPHRSLLQRCLRLSDSENFGPETSKKDEAASKRSQLLCSLISANRPFVFYFLAGEAPAKPNK